VGKQIEALFSKSAEVLEPAMNGSWKLVLPVGFVLYSLPLFLRVNGTSDYVIDEEFHIPQGLAFCRKEFDVVREKVLHIHMVR